MGAPCIKVERKDGVVVSTVVQDGDLRTSSVLPFSTSVENSSALVLPKVIKG